jgi:hypothetical protein
MITFAEAKKIVRAVEEADWTQGTYQIEDEGFQDATHYLVVRGTAEDDPNLVIVPGLVPLVNKATSEIEYVVAQHRMGPAGRHDAGKRLSNHVEAPRGRPTNTVSAPGGLCVGR